MSKWRTCSNNYEYSFVLWWIGSRYQFPMCKSSNLLSKMLIWMDFRRTRKLSATWSSNECCHLCTWISLWWSRRLSYWYSIIKMRIRILKWWKWKLCLSKAFHYYCSNINLRQWIHNRFKWRMCLYIGSNCSCCIFLHYWIRHWWKWWLHSEKNHRRRKCFWKMCKWIHIRRRRKLRSNWSKRSTNSRILP